MRGRPRRDSRRRSGSRTRSVTDGACSRAWRAWPGWRASAGRLERAALLLGAGAALSHELGITLFPYGQAHHDACEAAARAGLGEARYRDSWERGFALCREQVVAAALEDAPAPRGRTAAAAAHDADELSARELEVAG